MNIFFNILIQDLLSTIGVTLTILGIILAVIFYRRSQKIRKPCWAIRTTTLIEGYSTHLSNLEVIYNSEKVENLSVSRLCIWNDGRDTINRSDIAKANPLRIISNTGVKILDVIVLATNNSSSEFDVILKPDGLSASVVFEYLDYHQGGVIQVVHTGTNSNDISLYGDIKGAKPLQRKKIHISQHLTFPTPERLEKRLKPSIKRKIRAFMYLIMGVFILVLTIYSLFLYSVQGDYFEIVDFLFLIIVIIYFIMLSGMFFFTWRSQIPTGLEIFEEDLI